MREKILYSTKLEKKEAKLHSGEMLEKRSSGPYSWHYDNVSADQRLPHDSGLPVELDYPRQHGLTLSTVPLDTEGGWVPVVDKMANERGYADHDLATVVVYKVMVIPCSSGRHMHDDAAIRYILSSSGYCQWDIRGQSFALHQARALETDANPFRYLYLDFLKKVLGDAWIRMRRTQPQIQTYQSRWLHDMSGILQQMATRNRCSSLACGAANGGGSVLLFPLGVLPSNLNAAREILTASSQRVTRRMIDGSDLPIRPTN
ncbi:hypothetical protein EDB92DRAFT_1976389 [Lactarius akahatsu]|uniref:Uncharacterized protein n=1 Tax=Lactarius akahatsu TaxID=416441 RepID=A0AAD4L7K4_9AGAM|nr:hypothetical protein EDB92DRAFT_1976389 [Lactarius akahatsu]